MRKVFNTTVSVKEGASRSVLRGIVQYDTLNEVNIRLSDGSKAFDYTGYTNIIFKVLKADSTAYIDSEGENVIATSPVDGIITVNLAGQATTAAGLCQSVIEIYSGEDKMTTARFNYEVFESLDLDEAEVSQSQYPVFQNLMANLSALEAAIEVAEAARVDAEAARVAAEASRASAASGYVAKAAASAEAAANSAKMAQQAVSSGAHALTHAAGGDDPITPNMIGAMGGRNLLDNWHFGNPINQRGKTEYAGVVYTIDRWSIPSGGGVLTINSGGVKIDATIGSDYFVQILENAADFNGKQLTFTVLTTDGTLKSVSTVVDTVNGINDGVDLKTGSSIWVYSGGNGHLQVHVSVMHGYSVELRAAKLELGYTQTLAHQDKSGNWVLNDIPNFTEELMKCQRYFRRFPARYMMGTLQKGNIASFRYPLNPPMRVKPTLSLENGADLTSAIDNGANAITPTSVTLGWSTTNEVIGFWFAGASGDSFVCERYIDAIADL